MKCGFGIDVAEFGCTFSVETSIHKSQRPETGTLVVKQENVLTRNPVILVVDDDAAMRKLLGDVLRDAGCMVVEAGSGTEALAQLKRVTLDLIVTDLNMHSGGFEYVRNLKTLLPECPVIVVTAFGDSQSKKQAMESGVSSIFRETYAYR